MSFTGKVIHSSSFDTDSNIVVDSIYYGKSLEINFKDNNANNDALDDTYSVTMSEGDVKAMMEVLKTSLIHFENESRK